jgi:hypothetical protein
MRLEADVNMDDAFAEMLAYCDDDSHEAYLATAVAVMIGAEDTPLTRSQQRTAALAIMFSNSIEDPSPIARSYIYDAIAYAMRRG